MFISSGLINLVRRDTVPDSTVTCMPQVRDLEALSLASVRLTGRLMSHRFQAVYRYSVS